jgi:diguanylate cyclase (GGDEF)-like protein/hemerythrin-like metal-binding protein
MDTGTVQHEDPPQQRGGMQWLRDPTAHRWFMRFPLPLAILPRIGRDWLVNDLYQERYEIGNLDTQALRGIMEASDDSWHRLCLKRRDGGLSEVSAHATGLSEAVMLVIDETPGAEVPVELARLHARIDELEKLRSTDHLTGLWNRSHLDRVIAAELGRSRRFHQALSLILLDVDYFKDVNDTFGHQAGDSALRELAQLVTRSVRATDAVFRWGGEEFVVLATGTGYRNAEKVADTLRRRIETHVFSAVGHLTVSLGVAEHADGETAEAWFARVDRALYAAKVDGRNRTFVERKGNSDVWAGNRVGALHLVWQEAYACGEATIDREHRELFELANAAIQACQSRDCEAGVSALDRLLTHVARHFEAEEAILSERRYPKLHEHKAAHAALLTRAQALRESVRGEGPQLGPLVEFLADDVVSRHLLTVDRAFFDLFARDDERPTDGSVSLHENRHSHDAAAEEEQSAALPQPRAAAPLRAGHEGRRSIIRRR